MNKSKNPLDEKPILRNNTRKIIKTRPKTSPETKRDEIANRKILRKKTAQNDNKKLEATISVTDPSSSNKTKQNINEKESNKDNNNKLIKKSINRDSDSESIKLIYNVDKVAKNVSNLLSDIKKELGTSLIEKDSETIKIVSKRFFPDKLLTNGTINHKNNTKFTLETIETQNREISGSSSSSASAGAGAGAMLLNRRRCVSPSGNAKRPITSVNNSLTKIGKQNSKTSSSSSKSQVTKVNNSGSSKATITVRNEKSDSRNTMINYIHRAVSEVNPLGAIQAKVQAAIRQNKTFTVRGAYPAIRRALLQRGWVEKIDFSYKNHLQNEIGRFNMYSIPELITLMRIKNYSNICRTLIASKLLKNHQVDFHWSFHFNAFKENPDKIKYTLINKFRKDVFNYTSKQGLCIAAKNAYWHQIPGVAKMNHPRSYGLTKNGDPTGFIHDFNITAAMSLLKWIVKNNMTREIKIVSPGGKIPLTTYEFAVNECCKFIKRAQHEDIDKDIHDAVVHDWNQFLEYYYKIVHIGHHFKSSDATAETRMVRKCICIINSLKDHWPCLDMDGLLNIWILKPTMGSRGQGIHICRTLHYILDTVKKHPRIHYVVQKYIERPLLIYNTKFDIRQWFLISSSLPITIWIYKDCYLRFSSQTYNLRKLHESIHLTNNAVQAKYKKNQTHDMSLPSYNMWHVQQFRSYLANIGFPDAYNEIIYPGMRESITAAVLIHQDKIDRRPNTFELYGADFMLTEDFKPWLLEINSSPALYGSTPVTAKLCPQVLEDVIKVVVDKSGNENMSAGRFELVYKEKPVKLPKNNLNLKVTGKPLPKSYFQTDHLISVQSPAKCSPNSSTIMQCDEAQTKLKLIGSDIKNTLEHLMNAIEKEKIRREKMKWNKKCTLQSNVVDSAGSMKTARSNSSCESYHDARENISASILEKNDSKTTEIVNFMQNVIRVLQSNNQEF